MLSTIGYEGARPDHFLGTLQRAGVDLVIDVRDRAQSRRKGFSKTALAAALASGGIGYLHLRALGDPKPGRDAARAGEWAEFHAIYDSVLRTDAAQTALGAVADVARRSHACLLCYERDHTACHRRLISDILESRLGIRARHLGVQAIEPSRQPVRRMLHSGEGAAAPV